MLPRSRREAAPGLATTAPTGRTTPPGPGNRRRGLRPDVSRRHPHRTAPAGASSTPGTASTGRSAARLTSPPRTDRPRHQAPGTGYAGERNGTWRRRPPCAGRCSWARWLGDAVLGSGRRVAGQCVRLRRISWSCGCGSDLASSCPAAPLALGLCSWCGSGCGWQKLTRGACTAARWALIAIAAWAGPMLVSIPLFSWTSPHSGRGGSWPTD
ncbi:hypothetical protein QJS66_05195 [Kocuria rhizophila]|nr:hypothetical protein QJS66_05195 [Kocuria rhizophila]